MINALTFLGEHQKTEIEQDQFCLKRVTRLDSDTDDHTCLF